MSHTPLFNPDNCWAGYCPSLATERRRVPTPEGSAPEYVKLCHSHAVDWDREAAEEAAELARLFYSLLQIATPPPTPAVGE